jgi:TP901-1 family phage major tail protein
MTAQKGSLLLLKVGDGQPSETFSTVGGMRTTKLILNNQSVDATNKDSGAWRSLLSGAGIRSVVISGNGIFTDAASEGTVRGYAFANSIKNYKLTFGNGDILTGAFQIASYERAGEYDGEESYALTLESAGTITFTPA